MKIISKQRRINLGVGYKLEVKKQPADERRRDREAGMKRETHRKLCQLQPRCQSDATLLSEHSAQATRNAASKRNS